MSAVQPQPNSIDYFEYVGLVGWLTFDVPTGYVYTHTNTHTFPFYLKN